MTTTETTRETVAEFFPTPRDVIRLMLKPVYERLNRHAVVLEPSAGKGDILDAVSNVYNVDKANLYAIEANPELQYVLAGKGYRVLDSDFLTFSEPYRFDVILMNPPFSNGVDHALKAWDVVAPGGAVVCLLNAETLRNPYTEKRQLLSRIVEQYGAAEELGPVFKSATRSTDVDVTMITLHKPEQERLGYMDDVVFDQEAPAEEAEFSASPLANRDMLQSLVDQYNAVVRLTKERHETDQEIAFYLNTVKERRWQDEIKPLNEALAEVKALFWSYVFEKTRLGDAATSQFVEEFEQMRQHNSHMAFTVDNVMAVLDLLILNHGEIITRCIVDVFDKVTGLHEKNVIHTEGWKTNKSWKINRKIIVPYGVKYDKFGWSKQYYKRDFYNDLDKACCFLTGTSFEELRRQYQHGGHELGHTIDDRIDDCIRGYGDLVWWEPFDSAFFTVKIHKKGTVHLTFKDEDLWHKFNAAAAQGKRWVGPGY